MENNEIKNLKVAQEDWMVKKWRPAMGWMYMVVCIFDFILFPMFWAGIQFWETEAANDAFRQWNPLTLQGAGLFHMAMGAVLGITAWSRGQEKINGSAGDDGAPSFQPTPSPTPRASVKEPTPRFQEDDVQEPSVSAAINTSNDRPKRKRPNF